MHYIHTVLLQNDTVGTLRTIQPADHLLGHTVTVELTDQNGNPIQATGEVVEILVSESLPDLPPSIG